MLGWSHVDVELVTSFANLACWILRAPVVALFAMHNYWSAIFVPFSNITKVRKKLQYYVLYVSNIHGICVRTVNNDMILMPTLLRLKHLGPAIQRIEAKLWPIFNFAPLRRVIAEWCVTVRLRRYLGWVYEFHRDVMYEWFMRGERETRPA